MRAHSGFVLEVTDEGYTDLELMDWRCPRGMTPPTSAAEDSARRLPAAARPRPVTDPGRLADLQRTGGVDADVVRVGPLERTDTRSGSGDAQEWDTTYTARRQLRGTILDVTLPDSRSPQVTQSWTREVVRHRSAS